MTVGLVIVSHSEKIADGVVELAGQMAPEVLIIAAGGIDDGDGTARIGTSFERVQAAVERAGGSSDGVVILTDLGSAVMTAETVLEFLDPAEREQVRLARAALVEGAVAAAVQAQGGSALDEVVRAAESAVDAARTDSQPADQLTTATDASDSGAGGSESPEPDTTTGTSATGSWTLRNQMGLHARPAATLATGLADLDAEVLVNGVDGKSVMLLMSLGLGRGKTLTATATGPDAQVAVGLIGEAVGSGFGEPE